VAKTRFRVILSWEGEATALTLFNTFIPAHRAGIKKRMMTSKGAIQDLLFVVSVDMFGAHKRMLTSGYLRDFKETNKGIKPDTAKAARLMPIVSQELITIIFLR
jgi:hypothetical protein